VTKYQLWIDSDTLGVWNDPDEARRCILEYIESNPEEANLLHFTAYKSTSNGLKVLYALSGADEIREHFDAGYDG
jgi:Zn-dependent oligopeptidase